MTLEISVAKEKSVVKEAGEVVATLEAQVDEYGFAKEQVDSVSADLKVANQRLAKAKIPLEEKATEEFEPDEIGQFVGDEFDVSFGKESVGVVEIDKITLISIIGGERFIELASVPIGKIRAILTEEEQAKVLQSEFTGKRTYKSVRRK